MSKSKKILLLSIIVFFISFSAFNNSEYNETAPIDYKLNTPFICNGLDVLITNFQQKNSSNSEIVGEKEFIAVYVSVKNNKEQDLSFNEDFLNLVNDNGEIIKRENVTIDIWEGKRINNFTLEPGGYKEGYIIFSTTTINNKNLKIKTSCNKWEDEIIINLKQ
jgi:hypothetical protein